MWEMGAGYRSFVVRVLGVLWMRNREEDGGVMVIEDGGLNLTRK